MTDRQKEMIARAGLEESKFEQDTERQTDGILTKLNTTEDTADMAYVNSELALALLDI